MAIQLDKTLPAIVGTRNDTWIKVHLSQGTVLQMQILHQGSLIVTQKMPVDVAGNVSFNLKRILQSIGTFPDIIQADLPSYSLNIVTPCTKNIKDFSLVLFEQDAAGVQISTVTVNSTAILGGLAPELTFDTSLLSYLSGPPRRFLTNKLQTQLCAKDTQLFLYYFNSNLDSQGAVVSLQYRILYDDGTASITRIYSIQVIKLSIIPAGYQQLNLEPLVPAGKTVKGWEVWIDDSGVVSEVFTFLLDDRCYPDGRDLIFLNSLGGMDTLRIQQIDEVNLDRQSDVVERYSSADAIPTDGQYYETEVLTSRKFKASTSQLLAEERYWLQDFFASAKIFEASNGRFLPVRIISGTTLLKNRADYLAVSFEYRYRFDDIGYTKQ